MPPYTRGKKRETISFVSPLKGSNLFYGFKTKDLSAVAGVTQADITLLGHLTTQAATGSSGKLLIYRANSPKPARVKMILDTSGDPKKQGSVSTFCDADKLAAALSQKWSLVKPAQTVGGGGGKSRLVAIKVNGGYYGFPLNKEDYTAYAQKIGAENITDTVRLNLFTGASNPRPAKMGLTLTNGSSFSTFVADDKIEGLLASTQENWQIIEAAVPPLG